MKFLNSMRDVCFIIIEKKSLIGDYAVQMALFGDFDTSNSDNFFYDIVITTIFKIR